jgi:hypothetical protein
MPKSAPKIEKFDSDNSGSEEEEQQQQEEEPTQTQEEPELQSLKTYVPPAKKVKSEKTDNRSEKEKILKKAGWTNYTLWMNRRRKELDGSEMTAEEKTALLKTEWAAVPEDEKTKLQGEVAKFREIAREKYPEELKAIEEAKSQKRRKKQTKTSSDNEHKQEEEEAEAEGDEDREAKRKRSKGKKKPADERPAVSRNPRKIISLGEFFVWKKLNKNVPQKDQKEAFAKMKEEKGDIWHTVVTEVEKSKKHCDAKQKQFYEEDILYRNRVLVSAA